MKTPERSHFLPALRAGWWVGRLGLAVAALSLPLHGQTGCFPPDSNPPGLPPFPYPCPMQMASPVPVEFHGGTALSAFDCYLQIDGIAGAVRVPTADGGEDQTWTSTLTLTLQCAPGSTLPRRVISLPVQGVTHTGPRTAGAPAQRFVTELRTLGGEKTTDADFSLVRVRAGAGQGLPACPGDSCLQRVTAPGTGAVSWRTASFFDVFCEVECAGRTGTAWAAVSGKAEVRVRLTQGKSVSGGLDVSPAGTAAAVTVDDATQAVTVSNIGSSGQDGVSFALSKPYLQRKLNKFLAAPGFRITPPPLTLDANLRIKASSGDEAGTLKGPVSLLVGRSAQGIEASADFPAAATPARTQSVRISVWNGSSRVVVHDSIIICITDPWPIWPLAANAGRVITNSATSPSSCGVRVATGDVCGDGLADLATPGSQVAFMEWASPVQVTIPNKGTTAYPATRIEWMAMPLTAACDGFTQLDVLGAGLSSFVVGGCDITDGCRNPHVLGSATVAIVGTCASGQCSDPGLRVSNLGSSGQDGVEVKWPRACDSARVKIQIPDGNPPPYNPFPPDSALACAASGAGGGISAPHSFGKIEALHCTVVDAAPCDVQYVAPAGSTATTELRAAVHNAQGVLVGQRLMLATQTVKTTRIGPAGLAQSAKPRIVSMGFVRRPVPLRPYFSVVFDRATLITPSGTTGFTGTELRLYPTALATAVDGISSLAVTGRSLSTVQCDFERPETFTTRSACVAASPAGAYNAFSYPPPDRIAFERAVDLDNGVAGGAAATKGLHVRCELKDLLRTSSTFNSATGDETITATGHLECTMEGAGSGTLGTYRRTSCLPATVELLRHCAQGTHIKDAVLIKRIAAVLPGGDPDFDLLTVRAGSLEGLTDGTGEITGSQLSLPGVTNACYSLTVAADVSCTFSFVGKQGSALAAFSATKAAPVRLLPSVSPAATFAGADHSALGVAQLSQTTTTAGTNLVVSNIGSSGQDGVSCTLGGVDGYDLGFEPFSLNPGGYVDVSSWCWGATNAGAVRVSKPNAASNYQVSADFTQTGATGVIVEWWDGATRVLSSTVPAQQATIFLNGLPPGEPCPVGSIGKISSRASVSCGRIRFIKHVNISLQGLAMQPVPATEIRLLAQGASFRPLDHAEVRCASVAGGSCTITSRSTELGGRVYSFSGMLRESPSKQSWTIRESPTRASQGNARALPPATGGCFDMWEHSNQLAYAITPPATGTGTVHVEMETPLGMSVNTTPITMAAAGASCDFKIDTFTCCGVGSGRVHVGRDTTGTTCTTDVSAMGASFVQVVISSHRGGQKELELETILPATAQLVSIADDSCARAPQIVSCAAAIYWGFHQEGVSDPCMSVALSRLHPMTVGASTVQGDMIEIVPLIPATGIPGTGLPVSRIYGCDLQVGGCDSFVINEVTEGPVQSHGLATSGLGGASLGWSAVERRLHVDNLGSSGQDGVSVDLGKSDGWSCDLDPVTMGGVMVHAYGDTPAASNVLLGRCACSPQEWGFAGDCWGADFTALGTNEVVVEVSDGATVTGTFTMPAAAVGMIAPMGPGGKDPDLVRCAMEPATAGPGKYSPPGFLLEFDVPGLISPPNSTQVYAGYRVRLRPGTNFVGVTPLAVRSIECRPGRVWAGIECTAVPVTITAQALAAAECGQQSGIEPLLTYKGITQKGLKRCATTGGANIKGEGPCRISVANIGSSGQDGVSFLDLNTDGKVGFACDGGDLPPVCEWGLYATGTTTGTPAAGSGPLGVARIIRDDGTAGDRCTADFSALGSPFVTVVLADEAGAVLTSFVVQAGMPVPIAPETAAGGMRLSGCGKLPGGIGRTPCFFYTFDPLHKVRVTVPGGQAVVAAEIRLLALGGVARISKIDSFTIKGRLLPQVVLSPGPGVSSVTSFLASNFTPAELANPAVSGLHADPDFDGIDNLLEYAFGLNPQAASESPAISLAPGVSSEGGGMPVVKITFLHPSGLSGVGALLEPTADLSVWQHEGRLLPTSITAQPGGMEEVSFELPASAPRNYGRIVFTVPD